MGDLIIFAVLHPWVLTVFATVMFILGAGIL